MLRFESHTGCVSGITAATPYLICTQLFARPTRGDLHMKVAVVGLGYVGTVTAACMASHGHDVWGVDVDDVKVSDIRSGRSPGAEPGLDDLVAAVVAGGTLHATTSAAEALAGADLSLV